MTLDEIPLFPSPSRLSTMISGYGMKVSTSSYAARIAAVLLLTCAVLGSPAFQVRADDSDSSASTPVGRWQDASLDSYRRHLTALQALTQTCAKARDVQSCDPTLVGPDDRIPMSAAANPERRIVRYGWLRILFSRAEEPDKANQA